MLGLALAAFAAWAAGAAIKLVDAAVDQEPGWDPVACAGYGALLVALGAAARPAWVVSLVGGAWALGMASRRRIRDHLEAAAVLAFALWATGWRESLGSWLALAAVQAADLWMDREGWPARAGSTRGAALVLTAAGFLVCAAALDPFKAGMVFVLTPAAEAGAAVVGRVTQVEGQGGQVIWSS